MMNNLQATLLFPVRDADARKQWLIASAVMLASFIVPILPMLVVMGYGVKIMRQVIDEGREPTMPEWQSNDLGALLQDGFRLWAVRLVYTLPLMLLMGCGFIALFSGTGLLAALSRVSPRARARRAARELRTRACTGCAAPARCRAVFAAVGCTCSGQRQQQCRCCITMRRERAHADPWNDCSDWSRRPATE